IAALTYKDDLKQHLLVDLHVLLVPLVDIGILLAGIIVIVRSWCGIALVMVTPLNDLAENSLIDLDSTLGCHSTYIVTMTGKRTLAMGMASSISPQSSSMFLMSMLRSAIRSEERRVGKEGRYGWTREHKKENR